ncbi:cyclin-domain-containing protein [Coniophora puteana RWD-64-598 SS2]|uniref:Cyclin-domain-containing protein n=1 Tax=Coniophora puteana (strain RWD-64-598) TaxID=741705 RepID=A0A5M3MSN0_CONPW|nr:cyclin-domain-containing protein [Coniophora puteana RWD-64-598 SS2]EIW82172.1 cyclin-domain-containing protein [Coniophora puteana RWD-64-598 SS2]
MLALVNALHPQPTDHSAIDRSLLRQPSSSSSSTTSASTSVPSSSSSVRKQRKPPLPHSSSSFSSYTPGSSASSASASLSSSVFATPFSSRPTSAAGFAVARDQSDRPDVTPPPESTTSVDTNSSSSSRVTITAASTSKTPIPTPSTPTSVPNGIASPLNAAPAPIDIHTYPSTDLLRLLASLLTQIASTNDALPTPNPHESTHIPDSSRPPLWRTLTTASRESLANPTSALTFHARNIPTIALDAYLLRILKYCPTTNEVFLALLVYFDRMSRLAAEATSRTFVIDSYNVHRLVIAGVTVASKFFSDVFYTNSRYAKVGGLPQAELNQLELQFLLLNDFNLVISPQEMQKYAEQLVIFSQSTDPSASDISSSQSAGALPTAPPAHCRPLSFPSPAAQAADAMDTATDRNRTPSMRAARGEDEDARSILSEADTETETEGGSTTDDEPTIRPRQSSCSGDDDEDENEVDAEGVFRAEVEARNSDIGMASP